MRIEFHPDVFTQLHRLPRPVFGPVLRHIVALAQDPRPPGAVKLAGADDAWRLRVGDYRILYVVADETDTVTIYKVGHRREVYR